MDKAIKVTYALQTVTVLHTNNIIIYSDIYAHCRSYMYMHHVTRGSPVFISRQSIPEAVTCPLMTGEEEEALNGEQREEKQETDRGRRRKKGGKEEGGRGLHKYNSDMYTCI